LWSWQPPSVDPGAGSPYGWLSAVDGFGSDLAVLDTGDQRVHVTDFSGNPLAEWAIAPPDGFESVADLALAPGRVYLLNRSRRQVEVRARADGTVLDGWTVPGVASRVDVDADGNVYLLTREGWVWKRAPDGSEIAVWQVADDRSATDIAAGQIGRVYISFGDHDKVDVFAPDPAGTAPEVPEFEDHCTLQHDKTAVPDEIELGASVTIRLTAGGDCPLADARSDIMLLVDTSGSMSGGKMGAARSAALEFIGQLDYSLNQVGLISFSTDVDLVQGLTSNPRQLIRAVPDLGDDEGTDMLTAFQLADREFASERARREARKVIILLTDGRPNSGRSELLAMSASYRASGRDVYAIGLGLDADRGFLQALVTQANYYFEALSEHDLSRIYDTIAHRVAASVLLAHTRVSDVLPENMRYVRGSAVPPASYSPLNRTVAWELTSVLPSGLALQYQVVPQEPGVHPTNVRAEAEYVDGVGHVGKLTFPVPRVLVTAPQRWQLYLPSLMRRKCPEVRTDVVLVLDTSSSMRMSPAPGRPTKLDAAVHASRLFLSLLRLPKDRVAIVTFNAEAEVVQGLTGDHLALVQALDHLPTGTGTRLDLGLEVAREVLTARGTDYLPVIILLTDGRQVGASEATVLETARRARSDGIILFTVGLGEDADRSLLDRIAGDPQRSYFAPTEAQLAEIYRQIAGAIPCQ